MGMFSWNCHVCGASLRHAWPGSKKSELWRQDVVLVAEDGTRMEGKYDGYGRVGGLRIPKEWAQYGTEMVEGCERQADEYELRAKLMREGTPDASTHPTPEAVTEIAVLLQQQIDHYDAWAKREREFAKEMAANNVAFTAYHRRCWKRVGQPGFQGQSKRAQDQGW